MRPRRYFFLLLGLVGVLTALLAVLVFSPGIQTWAARRALAQGGGFQGQVGRVAATLSRIEVSQLKVHRAGIQLSLPSAQIDAPVFAATRGRVHINRFVAKGWILDLTGAGSSPVLSNARRHPSGNLPLAAIGLGNASATGSPALAPHPPLEAFEGIFAMLDLPVDFQLDEADLEGDVIFLTHVGQPPGLVHLVIKGGGMGVGKSGRFAIRSTMNLDGGTAPIKKISGNSVIELGMGTSRSFDRINLSTTLDAGNAQFPTGQNLRAEMGAEKASGLETYRVSVISMQTGTPELLRVDATFTPADRKMSGSWKINTRDGDLAPLTSTFAIPGFAGESDGNFASEEALDKFHAVGRFNAVTEKLGAIYPALSELGPVKIAGEFDLRQSGEVIRIDRLTLNLGAGIPALSIEALQAIELDGSSGDLKVSDPTRDLMRLRFQGLPLSSLNSLVKGYAWSAEDMRGELIASMHGDMLSVRSVGPLKAIAVNLAQNNSAMLARVDVSADVSAQYQPHLGWEADVSGLLLQSAQGRLLRGSIKCGTLFASGQPFKATGQIAVDLPIALKQPLFSQYSGISTGQLDASVSAIAGSTASQFAVKLNLSNLASLDPQMILPTISVDGRADVGVDGIVKLVAPVVIQSVGRRTDFRIAVSVQPESAAYAVDGQVSGNEVYLEDLKIFIGLSGQGSSSGQRSEKANTKSSWPGFSGKLHWEIGKLIYSPALAASNVVGDTRIGSGSVVLDRLKAEMNDGSTASVSAELKISPETQAYAASGEVNLNKVNPGPVLALLSPQHKPTAEGEFDLEAKFSSEALQLDQLVEEASVDLKLTSRGGKFHGFAASARGADISKYQKAVSTVGSFLEAAAGIVGAPIANTGEKIRAVSDVLGRFIEIQFDQLNLEVSHQPGREIKINDFSMISPELRFVGTGTIETASGKSWLNQPLHLDLQLAVRGKQAADMKLLGVLQEKKDALGYIPLSEKIPVEGSISNLGMDALVKMLMRILTKA